MSATEYPIRDVVAAGFRAIHERPNLINEPLRYMNPRTLSRIKGWFAEQPVIEVRDAWPNVPPQAPMVVVQSGEGEEADQYVGTEVGISRMWGEIDDSFADGDYAAEVSHSGTLLSSTHHVLIYSPNADVLAACSRVALWSLWAMRNWLTATYGLYEQRLIEGPMGIADEWGAPEKDTVWVFRRSVHLVHKWMLYTTERAEGEILARVDVNANILGYLAP